MGDDVVGEPVHETDAPQPFDLTQILIDDAATMPFHSDSHLFHGLRRDDARVGTMPRTGRALCRPPPPAHAGRSPVQGGPGPR